MTLVTSGKEALLAMEGRDSRAEVSTLPPCTHSDMTLNDVTNKAIRLKMWDCGGSPTHLVNDADGISDVDLLIGLPQFALPVHRLPE